MSLAHLGQNKMISSIDDATVEGRTCKLFLDTAIEDVLRDHDWNFATKDVSLAQLSETVSGWAFLYARPANCLYVRSIHAEGSELSDKDEFEEIQSAITNQRSIATDTASARAKYTANVKDPNLFDPSFVLAVSYKLAAMMAQPITGNIGLSRELLGFYQTVIDRAKGSNRAEKNVKKSGESSYVNAR